jgi:hypothetical protein
MLFIAYRRKLKTLSLVLKVYYNLTSRNLASIPLYLFTKFHGTVKLECSSVF